MRAGSGFVRRPVYLRLLVLALPLVLPRLLAADAGQQVAVLNAQNWQIAQGLLPEEFLARYKNGEWTHEIWTPPSDTNFFDRDFIAAGANNEGKFEIGPQGQIVEKATGEQPKFIYGPPFPKIDPADPQAGSKIIWNFFYQSYSLGNTHSAVNLDWVGTRGLDRSLSTDVYQQYFDGQAPKYQPKENPQNFLFRQRTTVTAPADLQGTISLTHRFRDPAKRDQVWTYVPALRRVRAVSPTNRSDGFLGSDMSQDDGSYFDGKPEDFTWKLAGEGELLMLYDRTSLLNKEQRLSRPEGGGSQSVDSLRPRFNFQLPNWSGHPWAPLPTEYVLVKRPVWIVEGVPKDKYYLFGKFILRFDKESWRGTYNSKYDWKGEILNSYLPVYGPFFLNGDEWHGYASCLFTMAQNFRLNRATASHADDKHPATVTRIAFPEALFAVDALSRSGK